MSKHTTNQTSQEIPCGYCQCGCGQKTNISQYTSKRNGWKRGEPLRYVFGHQHRANRTKSTDANPDGFCLCGCGQKTPIATKTDRGRGHIKGEPLRYIVGHNHSAGEWVAPEFCACGCGQRLKKASGPSHQARYISGHNSRPKPVESRFWARVNKQGSDDCWIWQAGVGSHGYGTMSVNGSPQCSHRIAWSLANGPIPNDLHVLHRCDNRLCCNPAHLFLGTNLDNIHDMVKKGRQAKGKDKPDQRGEASGSAVLTAADVIEIRQRCAAGESQDKLAEIYGVSQGHISNVFRRVTWKHI